MKGKIESSEIKALEHQSVNIPELNIQLFDAIRTKNVAKVKELIKAGADVNFKADFKCEYIDGDHPDVQNAPDYYKGATLLTVATHRGCLDIVNALIEAGANVNAKSFYQSGGRLALTYAVLSNNIKIVERLLSAGSEVNYVDPAGDETPLEMAEKSPNIRELLFKYGALESSEGSSCEDYSYSEEKSRAVLSLSDMIADHKKLQELIEQVQSLQVDKSLLNAKLESQNQNIIQQQNRLDKQQEQISWLMRELKAVPKISGDADSISQDVPITGEVNETTASCENNLVNDYGSFFS